MNWKKIIGIVVLLAVVAVVVIRLMMNKETTQEKVYHFDKEKPIAVNVDTIQFEKIDDFQKFTGTFQASKESKISAEIQGKIISLFVDEGDKVQKGEKLIALDHSLLRLQLQSLDVQIRSLQEDVRRYKVLTEADAIQGVKLEKTQTGLEKAKIQKSTLQEKIRKSTIRAPFDGIVTAKLNEEGGFAAPGMPLLQITAIDYLKFTVMVSENEISNFQKHQSYPITVDAFPDTTFSGELIMIGNKANKASSFPLQFQVENTENLMIKSGMFGKVNLSMNKENKGILIPSAAIIEVDGRTQVYILENKKAKLTPIGVVKSIKNKSLVAHGLKEGDVLISRGFVNLFDGAVVRIEN